MLLLIVAALIISLSSCDKDEKDDSSIYMGIEYTGQQIPMGTKYSYTEGTYTASVSFIDENSYNWGQSDVQGIMSMVVPCSYNSVTGEFSDTMIAGNSSTEYGAIQYYPISFVIDDMNKLYLHTNNYQIDTSTNFHRYILEKTSGEAGTLEGTYTGSFYGDNWIYEDSSMADMKMETTVSFTYEANTFSGTYVTRLITESTMDIPEYGIIAGISDNTETTAFSGTWIYNKANNTITETFTTSEVSPVIYTPYWVSYNEKTYLVTSLTRYYQKD